MLFSLPVLSSSSTSSAAKVGDPEEGKGAEEDDDVGGVEEHGPNWVVVEGGRLRLEEHQHQQEEGAGDEVQRTDVEGAEDAQAGQEDGAHGGEVGHCLAVASLARHPLADVHVLGEDGQRGDGHGEVGHDQRPPNRPVVAVHCLGGLL